MISLFIDTSSSCLNIALLNDNNVIKVKSILLGKDLSKEALYEIKCLIESANLKPNDIDRVVCVSGPGSFTGLRVGVTISSQSGHRMPALSVEIDEQLAITETEELLNLEVLKVENIKDTVAIERIIKPVYNFKAN